MEYSGFSADRISQLQTKEKSMLTKDFCMSSLASCSFGFPSIQYVKDSLSESAQNDIGIITKITNSGNLNNLNLFVVLGLILIYCFI